MGSGLRYTGNYGQGRQEFLRAKSEAQQAAEKALLRATHDRNQKLNRINRERGQGGKFTCPPQCETCYPVTAGQADHVHLAVRDLRAGKAAPKRPTGKKGRCRICGEPCPRSCYYHRRCRLEPPPQALPRTCRWCGRSLPEGTSPKRKWCGGSCRGKAQRAKVKAQRRSEGVAR